MASQNDGVGLAATGIGILIVYAGIRGYSPLGMVENLISGKQPATGVGTASLVNKDSSALGLLNPDPSSSAQPTGGNSDNEALGRQLAAYYGWDSGSNWDSLVRLWTRESGWSNTARNPSSGAYGIPQALPASKLPKAALPPTNDARSQILWGLNYIQGRYGNPVRAWAHETSAGWY